jgi:hypothetical protein
MVLLIANCLVLVVCLIFMAKAQIQETHFSTTYHKVMPMANVVAIFL